MRGRGPTGSAVSTSRTAAWASQMVVQVLSWRG